MSSCCYLEPGYSYLQKSECLIVVTLHECPHKLGFNQFRMNNNSKCSKCYGTCVFEGPAVLRVEFVLYYMQEYNFQSLGKS